MEVRHSIRHAACRSSGYGLVRQDNDLAIRQESAGVERTMRYAYVRGRLVLSTVTSFEGDPCQQAG